MTQATLFDSRPDEPSRGGRKRQASSQKSPSPPPAPAAPRQSPAIVAVGKIDHTYACADSSCGAECHDILLDDGRQWLIQCCFCHTAQWVAAIKGHISPADGGVFRFPDGRFAGKTCEEAAADPVGVDYMTRIAETHRCESVREAVRRFLIDIPHRDH